MRRGLSAALALLLAIATPAQSEPSAAQRRQWRETAAQCPALRTVDFAALAESGFDPQLLRRQMGWSGEAHLDGADVVLRFYAPPGFGGLPAWTTRTTARRVNGQWRLTRTDTSNIPAPPTPPDPGAPPDPTIYASQYAVRTTEGPLAARHAALLDAALADPCFAREPDYAPASLPLRGGHYETCMDGSPFSLQIERAEGVRTVLQICQRRWRAGEIISVLETAQPEPATVTDGLTPRITQDEMLRRWREESGSR